MYSTHDYLAESALKMLREAAPEAAEWILEREFFYGTELPDSRGYSESINDLSAQYLRFNEDGTMLEDSLALRAMGRNDGLYGSAINALSNGAYGTASKHAGAILSYVQNAGLFSRVIDNPLNGYNFERNIMWISNIKHPSNRFEELYGGHIEFDGSLEMISPYDAVMKIGQATFMGKKDDSCSARWMDDNYDPENPDFIACAGRNFNNIINAQVDVLYTLYQAGKGNTRYEVYAYDWAKPITKEILVPEPPATNDSIPGPIDEILPPVELPPEIADQEEPEPTLSDLQAQDKKSDPLVFYIAVVVLVSIIFAMAFKAMKKPVQRPSIKQEDNPVRAQKLKRVSLRKPSKSKGRVSKSSRKEK